MGERRSGSLKAFGVWFLVTFVIGAFGFGQRITEPPTLVGAALVAAGLAWFMAFKVMPSSGTPRPRRERSHEVQSSNQLKLILIVTAALFVLAVVIALVQSL